MLTGLLRSEDVSIKVAKMLRYADDEDEDDPLVSRSAVEFIFLSNPRAPAEGILWTMGIDPEMFVHPERISDELICPICHCVVENPVQTPSEHLFCEDELLEWMTNSDICPITNEPLDPDGIRKPGRIIKNMLAALERYCPNRSDGCTWQGSSDRLDEHTKECQCVSRAGLMRELGQKDTLIALLRGKLSVKEERVFDLEEQNAMLRERVNMLQKQVQVYDAFFKEGSLEMDSSARKSDVGKLSQLRQFESRARK